MRSALKTRAAGARILVGGSMAVIAGVAVAACGATPSATRSPSPSTSAAARATPSRSPTPGSGVLIKTAARAKLGAVLVDSKGRTLYTLSSETNGKITCTVSSGCTAYWGELDLPSGITAVSAAGGAKPVLIGTETGATGTVVTYNGWPLYTYSGDSGAGQANGEGVTSFGGTWYVLSAAGNPVTSTASPTASPSSGGGY